MTEGTRDASPTTEAGRQAVKMRGLFGGETEERATEWVRQIEAAARQQGRREAIREVDGMVGPTDGDWLRIGREEWSAILNGLSSEEGGA